MPRKKPETLNRTPQPIQPTALYTREQASAVTGMSVSWLRRAEKAKDKARQLKRAVQTGAALYTGAELMRVMGMPKELILAAAASAAQPTLPPPRTPR